MALTRFNSKGFHILKNGWIISKRTFLSDAFDLKAVWNQRLSATIFQSLDMEKYFLDIDRQYVQTGLISHIDLDIFANGLLLSRDKGVVTNSSDIESRFEQLEVLLRRFRATPEAIKLLDSTTHAIVRQSFDAGSTDLLMTMLNNRLKYGLILDDYTNTFQLNKFLQAKNYRDAAKTGIFMMLQEEYNVPIASSMSLLSTFSYIRQLRTEENLPVWDPMPEEVPEEPEDEVKIRVEEIENPHFDDHFDLVQKEHLLGKTLYKLASNVLPDSTVRNSLQLLGLVYHEKWDMVNQISGDKAISKDCLEEAVFHAQKAQNLEIEGKLKRLNAVDSPIEEYLTDLVKKDVQKHQDNYIKSQTKIYNSWIEHRETLLQEQEKRLLQRAKSFEIDQSKRKLIEKEEKLFFFDNYEKMEADKREKLIQWRKTFPLKTGILFGSHIEMKPRDPNSPFRSRHEKRLAKRAAAEAKK